MHKQVPVGTISLLWSEGRLVEVEVSFKFLSDE